MIWLVGGLAAFLLLLLIFRRAFQRLFREVVHEKARELFALQREHLEAKFLTLAAASGKPKGLVWKSCEFHSAVCFARDRKSGQLTAFVEVTIQFSAQEGGGMENVEAVSNLRHASALFHYQHGQWGTGGRALFNMAPEQAIEHFRDQFDVWPTVSHTV